MALDIGPMTGTVMNFVGMILLILFAIASAVGAVIGIQNIMKYNVKVRIWFTDAMGNLQSKSDTGGTFVDRKNKMKLFWLRKSKVGMKPDKVPYIPVTKKGLFGNTVSNEVNVYQHGLRNFAFITPKVGNPSMDLVVSEEDFNWYLSDKAKVENMFNKNQFMQMIISYGMFIVAAFLVIIMIYILLQKFEVLGEVATQLGEVAKELAKAKAGTTIIE